MLWFLFAAKALTAGGLPPCTIETVAGGGERPLADGIPALEASLVNPRGIGLGPGGELLIADPSADYVLSVGGDGLLHILAGNGERDGLFENDVPATQARLGEPVDVATASNGDVLIVDRIMNQVRRIDSEGILRAFAGSREIACRASSLVAELCGDGGPPTKAQLPLPRQIEVDPQGVVYVLHDFRASNVIGGPWIRRIRPGGSIDTLPWEHAPAVFNEAILGFGFDPSGGLVAQPGVPGGLWFRINEDGVFSEAPSAAGFLAPTRGPLAIARDGSIFVWAGNGVIYRVQPDGRLSRISGMAPGPFGEGDPASQVRLDGVSDLLIDDQDNLYLTELGAQRVRRITRVTECPAPERPWIAWDGARQGASYAATLSPGSIFSVFGRNLGPDDIVRAGLGADGRLPTELEGIRVLVDGIPAPLIFVSGGQVGAVVPWQTKFGGSGLADFRFARIEMDVQGILSDPRNTQVIAASPGIFTLDASGDGQAAALNQDGSVNGPGNPARQGSILVFFATGGGMSNPAASDGAIAEGPGSLSLPVALRVGFSATEILYAGPAPGLVQGVVQINARIATSLTAGANVPVELNINGIKSTADPTVAVGPD